ncbi:MAG: TetR/AcrR family transcriptional regulator [Chloroflexi bacterium AL-W]|nr:TetR/AcrR family transcriptional regulator [Chloroflexi bacterium AL-N1]NOK65009.1 TetR/AcrR family transcriptional regulator [Chloroflexi bacterium AL-N10]NOK76779.1 TetR/AcrR family transcriptional regulator [Chloroflexi bacterium AL-N5]NOK84671.1 TetR/AcrR family transcriptional regulator [Chloroflexi bacterium AL-W]NOK86505.1 TetR/AcrR family transcriptional regulator [Chloroflexi bacterium AL-N15]
MTKSDNKEREQRILDVAVDLFVHYGYDKTTISDIARKAGVSQGAIYLHFDSKDALLEGLVIRETKAYAERWLALIEADPKGGTIGAMYKNSLYALSASPFMSAMYRQDSRILGNYIRKPDNFFRRMRDQQTESGRYTFVKMMQEAGVMRQDMDPRVVAHIMDMLAHGLVEMDEVIDKASVPPVEDIIEGIADIMDRALTLDDGSNTEDGKAILRQIADAGFQQFQQLDTPDQE